MYFNILILSLLCWLLKLLEDLKCYFLKISGNASKKIMTHEQYYKVKKV